MEARLTTCHHCNGTAEIAIVVLILGFGNNQIWVHIFSLFLIHYDLWQEDSVTSLSLSFFFCKMETVVVTSQSIVRIR